MARHNFNDAELGQYQSANSYRDEIERRERERDEKRRREKEKKERKDSYKTEQKMIERHIRSEIRHDPIAGEIYEHNMGSKLVVGMAMLVASTAADAAYNKAIMAAQGDYMNERKAEEMDESRRREIETTQRQTLADYSSLVEETRNNLEATQKSYYVEYQETRKEAQLAIDAANKAYEKESLDLRKEEKRSDATYRKEMDAANDSLRSAEIARDADIQRANDRYQSEVQRINSEYSGSERDKELQRAAAQRDSAVQNYNDSYNKQSEDIHKHIDTISQRHSDEIKSISDRVVEAETRRDSVVNHQNDIIRTEQIKYRDAVREAKTDAQNAVVRRDSMQSAMAVVGPNGETAAQLALRKQTNRKFEHFSTVADGEKVGSGAQRFIDSVKNSHSRLGNDLACVFGSKEEVDLINKVNADREARAEAKKKGIEPPVELATKEDYAAVAKIEKKYAGDMSSEKGLRESIKTINESINALNEKQNGLSVKIAAKNDEIAKIDNRLSAVQSKINEIAADKKMLSTGHNVDGSKLTADQKSKIEARIQANGGMVTNRKQLSELMMKKNAAQNDLDGLKIQSNKNKAMIDGAKTHVAQLEKNGKAIVLANQRAEALSNRAWGMIRESTTMMEKKFNKATLKGNVFYEAKEKRLRSMKQASQRYELALKYSDKAMKLMRAGSGFVNNSMGRSIRIIGKNTRLGKAISSQYQAMMGKLRQTKFGQKMQSGAAKLQKGKEALGKFGGKAVKAPLKILQAPEKRRKARFERKKEAFRTARKEVGKVTGYVGRQAAKPFNAAKQAIGNKVRETEAYKRWSSRFNLVSNRINLLKDRAASFLGKYNPFKKLKGVASQFITMITSALSAIGSFFLTILSYLLSFLFLLIIIIVILLVIVSLFTSVLNAVAGFFKSMSVYQKSLVANNPEYVINQAVNYRNEELNIFELFVDANDDPSIIEVSKSPIYYSLYYEESLGDQILNFFDIDTTEDRKLSNTNTQAADMWDWVLENYDVTGYSEDMTFESADDLTYTDVKVSYYTANDLKVNDDGSYYTFVDTNGQLSYDTKDDAVASLYEISNAKDAMAMVDAIYTNKAEHMQKMEVLSYLGVGDYQIGYRDSAGNPTNIADNLFWATHKFIYRSGNKNEDIKFLHPTQRVPGTDNFQAVGCSNPSTYEFEKQTMKTIETCNGHDTYHTAIEDRHGNCLVDHSECNNYSVYVEYIDEENYIMIETCEGHTEYHESTEDSNGNVLVDNDCTDYEIDEEPIYTSCTFQVCNGHIDLDVAIVVTLLSDDGQIYKEAATIPGVTSDEYVGGLFTYDKANDVLGFGVSTHNAYIPSEDWAEGSPLRDLAKVKAENDTGYQVEDGKYVASDSEAKDANKDKEVRTIALTHYDGSSMGKSLAISSDRRLLYAMFVGSHQFYVESLISGEQKDLVFYKRNGDGSYGPDTGLVSFEITRYTNIPFVNDR